MMSSTSSVGFKASGKSWDFKTCMSTSEDRFWVNVDDAELKFYQPAAWSSSSNHDVNWKLHASLADSIYLTVAHGMRRVSSSENLTTTYKMISGIILEGH